MTHSGFSQSTKHEAQLSEVQGSSGHFIWHAGSAHFTSQLGCSGGRHSVWHESGSHIGEQTASHFGSSHFQEHWGWQSKAKATFKNRDKNIFNGLGICIWRVVNGKY